MTDVATTQEIKTPDVYKKEEPSVERNSEEIKKDYMTYVLSFVVICIVVYLLYNAYLSFCNNRNESFLQQQPRTDTQSDKNDITFDMDIEIKKLIQMQEKYLEQNSSR
jgi:hypothetical protein